jgi:tRNA (guanine37-N1)-methyltransferase
MEVLEGVHPRIKVVIDNVQQCGSFVESGNENEEQQHTRKRILLMSSNDVQDSNNSNDTDQCADVSIKLSQILPHLPQTNIQQLLTTYNALPAPSQTISIPYQNQSVSRILSKLLPESAMPPPSSYEQIGHVAHLNLRANHLQYGKMIGSVLLDRIDGIKTVVNKLGEVGGPYRTYQVDLLAGEMDYNVHVVEHGTSLYFDLTKVYWCTRLEGERTNMIQNEFQPNQVIADAFCGVGALCIRAALAKGCTILANDLNPDAVSYCLDSAKKNGIVTSNSEIFQVQCGDAREFIMNLGMRSNKEASVSNLPHHLILNFPLDSPSFLNALRWWPSGEKMPTPPRVHVYTFARGDKDRTANEVAIDMVADGLLPEGGYIEPSKFRGEYLNAFGCNVEAREIRDAAPGKLVVCVSFSVTRMLLRRMQGDYGY